jgi:hypothetical protein
MSTPPAPVLMVATCHTPGCPMDGIPQTAPFQPNEAAPVFQGWCDPCQSPVTDIVPPA